MQRDRGRDRHDDTAPAARTQGAKDCAKTHPPRANHAALERVGSYSCMTRARAGLNPFGWRSVKPGGLLE